MRFRRWLLLAVLAVAILLLLGRALAAVYVDYLWYSAMGAGRLWGVKATTTTVIRLLSGLAASLFIFANLYAVRRSVVSLVLPRRVANIEIGEEVPGRYLVGAAAILSLLLGALLTLPADTWLKYLLARYGREFGDIDTIFDLDARFFVFWLPLETTIQLWGLIAVLLVTAVVVFLYALTPSLHWERGTLYVSNYVRRHLVVLGSLLLLVLAWSYRIDAYEVLLDGSGVGGVVTYADHHARIPVNIALSVLTAAMAMLVLWSGWTGQLRIAFAGVTIVLVLALVLRQLVPPVVQRSLTPAEARTWDDAYRHTRASFTRRAYALRSMGADPPSLELSSATAAAGALSVWDPYALAEFVRHTRRGDGLLVSVGWEASSRGLLAVVAHGQDAGSGAPLRPWSVARMLASAADSRGEPIRVSGSAFPIADDSPVEAALVHPGATGYLEVADPAARLPAARLDGTLSRLAHAWSFQDFRMLFRTTSGRSRLVSRRDLRARVEALAPFFAQGSDVHPLVADDTLYWALDLYATTTSFPLSESIEVLGETVTYLHHAATAVVNSHTGRVSLVVDSVADPITRSWTALFPRLFVGRSGLRPEVRGRLPPAIDGARAQSSALVALPRVPGGPSRTPESDGADSLLREGGAALMMFPAGGGTVAWTLPLLDEAEHVTRLVVATGGPSRGTATLSVSEPGPRWSRVRSLLHQALDTGGMATRGDRIVSGAVRTATINGVPFFVQPTYSWPPDAAPSLALVSVLAGDSASAGRTLAEAVNAEQPTEEGTTVPVTPAEFRARVDLLYERMRAALRRGDLRDFGEAYDALGVLLARTPR